MRQNIKRNLNLRPKSSVTLELKCSKPILQGVASKLFHPTFLLFPLLYFLIFPSLSYSFMSDNEIAVFQKQIADKPIGSRIAFWAEQFINTPYDPDPLGEYVKKKVIAADKRVDCMYHTFRTVELSLSSTPEQAVEVALDKRFMTKGKVDAEGKVINYEDRFQYGEDMLASGKWGQEITADISRVKAIRGSRGKDTVKIILKKDLLKVLGASSKRVSEKKSMPLKDGDIIFFIKAVEKRTAGEIVGHIGFIKIEKNSAYLIHAAGSKNKDGMVKKVRLIDYLKTMPFIGARISRF